MIIMKFERKNLKLKFILVYGKQLSKKCSINDQTPCGVNMECSTTGYCNCSKNFVPLDSSCGKFI